MDFSQFDGNNDGVIDATLFSVPTAAGDDNWWPCAGPIGDSAYTVDGVTIGHIITGNAQIESETITATSTAVISTKWGTAWACRTTTSITAMISRA